MSDRDAETLDVLRQNPHPTRSRLCGMDIATWARNVVRARTALERGDGR